MKLDKNKTVALGGLSLFACGILLGGFAFSPRAHSVIRTVSAMEQEGPKLSVPDVAAMQADIARLKELVPSQSHAMTDVAFQFSNLWFAGKAKNWPLADFFLSEARQHVRWTIRIRPIRKDLQGRDVDLKGIFDSIDNGVLVRLKQSIDKQDSAQFAVEYKRTLEDCYSCHKASGKPYLRPMVPTVPPQSIINYDPSAKWPE